MVAHWVWELPGQNMNGPLKHIVGGWQANGILSMRSGFPYTIRADTGDLNVSDSSVRPDLVGDPHISNPTRKLWYNPQAFQRVTCNIELRQDLCHFGNNGYNNLDSKGQFGLDFGAFKNFQVTESVKVQFRWEMFNATNTPYFGAPGGLEYSASDVIVPDGSRDGEIRSTRTPMRIQQVALKIFF